MAIIKNKVDNSTKSFPNKWFMVITEENQKAASEWRLRQPNISCEDRKIISIGYTLVSEHHSDNSKYFSGTVKGNVKYKDYTEITFEQFKKNILKQESTSIELPHNWFILIDSVNVEIIKKWWADLKYPDDQIFSFGSAYGMVNNHPSAKTHPSDFNGARIDFEQFERLVLKKDSILTTLISEDLGNISFLKDYPEILENIRLKSSLKSLEAYKKNKYSTEATGGFNWSESPEGNSFWEVIFGQENPEHYFTIYFRGEIGIDPISNTPPEPTSSEVEEFPKEFYLEKMTSISEESFRPSTRRSAFMHSKPKKIQEIDLIPVKQRRII